MTRLCPNCNKGELKTISVVKTSSEHIRLFECDKCNYRAAKTGISQKVC